MKRPDPTLYLDDIRTAIDKIRRYTKDGKRSFLKDEKTQDAVIQNLMVIGEATKKLPKSITNKHANIPWKNIAGMRDILIHDYSSTDIDIIWNTIKQDLPPLLAAVESLLES